MQKHSPSTHQSNGVEEHHQHKEARDTSLNLENQSRENESSRPHPGSTKSQFEPGETPQELALAITSTDLQEGDVGNDPEAE